MNAFSGRPRLNVFTNRGDNGCVEGILSNDGPKWKEQRRFSLRNLRDFGYGTKTMEAKIQDEINELLESLRGNVGLPVQVQNLFNRPVINSLWSIMFGRRMEANDPESLAAFEGLAAYSNDSSFLRNFAIFFPWIAKIAPKLSGFEEMFQGFSNLKRFIRQQIKQHNVDYVENQPRDLVDAYTDEVNRTTDPDSSFHVKHNAMPHLLTDLFGAGEETTSSTLSWFCLYLLHHTEVQKKFQDEIDEVIGKQRLPALLDRPSMPYAEAVINEVLRFSSHFPCSVLHSALEAVEFQGFLIPKDSIIIPNVYGVHFDEKIWVDPENFRPERFLDANNRFKKNENLYAFSVGKRVCLGEGLARDQLFLFTTNLLQNFSLFSAGKLPNLEPHEGLTLTTQPFEMILKKRVCGD